jgi:hypothetical protein
MASPVMIAAPSTSSVGRRPAAGETSASGSSALPRSKDQEPTTKTDFAAAGRRAARAAGAAVSISGLIALFGRAADIPLLCSLHQGWASMKPNTAAGFVAAGMALYLSSLDRRDRFRRAGAACAAFAALIGLLTLVEYAFAVDLGIGQILFAVSGGSHAARMSPASASCLVIYGAALLLGTSARLRLRLVSENLSILVLLAAYVAILGYAYDVSVLYAVGPYNSVVGQFE